MAVQSSQEKVGDTEYGVGVLPLGGYVKISGIIDESFDTDHVKTEPKPWDLDQNRPGKD